MPKLKSHRGLRKRVKISGTGKVMRMRAGKSHLQTGKSSKRRRQKRKAVPTYKAFAKEMRLYY
jgi:large subunit ribosomal protein L35